MDLKSFLLKYPQVQLADHQDNLEILDFFKKADIQGNEFSIWYDRSPNFFDFLNLHSDKSFVFIYRNSKNEIKGVATALVRKGYLDQNPCDLMYLGDLRVGLDRRAAVIWRKVYEDLIANLKNITEFKNCKLAYTCTIDSNLNSFRNLIEQKKSKFKYEPLANYKMNLIFLRSPQLLLSQFFTQLTRQFFFLTKNSVEVKIADESNLSDLIDFYFQNESDIQGGYMFSQEIPYRLNNWPEFKISNFLIIRFNSKVVMSAALWSPQSCKKIMVNNAPKYLKFLVPDKILKVTYLTHFMCDQNLSNKLKQKFFNLLLAKSYELTKKDNYRFLGICHWTDLNTFSPKGYIAYSQNMKVFQVISEKQTPIPIQKHFGFEMSLV